MPTWRLQSCPPPIISYTSNLALGRVTDYSSTSAGIVDGCFNVRNILG